MPRPAWQNPLYCVDSVSLGGHVVLTNIGTTYIPIAVVALDFTNVAKLTFSTFVNKVGSGTQSWQLWNLTDGVEIAVLDDAGAAGNKTLGPVEVTSGLPTGLKVLQLRAKSTTSADDPIHRGSYLLLE